MSQTVTGKDGTVHNFPDEATPDQIKSAMDRFYSKSARPKVPVSVSAPLPAGMIPLRPEWLPTAGGFAGGLAAGPLGAGVGGAVGEGLRQLQTLEPPSLGKAATEGGWQAAQELTGLGIAKGLGKMTRPMIRKTVAFQRAPTPSVILNEFGKPFMIEGKAVEFVKRAPKEAHRAADVALDVASHALGPGGAFVRPAMRGLRAHVASGASNLGSFINGPGFQNFARQFPRASAALVEQLRRSAEPDMTSYP